MRSNNPGLPHLAVALALATLLSSASAISQEPQSGQAEEDTATKTVADAFGRETPRGAVIGYLEAADQGDFEKAAEYSDRELLGAGKNTVQNDPAD